MESHPLTPMIHQRKTSGWYPWVWQWICNPTYQIILRFPQHNFPGNSLWSHIASPQDEHDAMYSTSSWDHSRSQTSWGSLSVLNTSSLHLQWVHPMRSLTYPSLLHSTLKVGTHFTLGKALVHQEVIHPVVQCRTQRSSVVTPPKIEHHPPY